MDFLPQIFDILRQGLHCLMGIAKLREDAEHEPHVFNLFSRYRFLPVYC
jgi:hypothetical protein